MRKLLTKNEIAVIFDRLAEQWPNAHCELVYNNPFQLVMAVVLSAQATDKSVNKALAPLLVKNPNFGPQDLLLLGETKFRKVIMSIGLANSKAANLIALAKEIEEDFAGAIPSTEKELMSLPGVGRKSANVIRNVLFNEPTMPVDTHVSRVARRLGVVNTNVSLLRIEHALLSKVPAHHLPRAHHYLIFHGRYLCQARKPTCQSCSVADLCKKQQI